jgi:predicted nucleic acid-binding Zn ribbon protein
VRNRSGAHNVSDLLAEVFKRGGLKRGVRRAEAVLLWPQVVGAKVAKFSEAKTLQDGVLFVEVQDSETAMHLSFQRQKFVNVYRAKFGVRDVKDVRFRTGRRPLLEEEAPQGVTSQPDPRALAELSRTVALAELSDELSRSAMQVAKAMLSWRAARQAEGWVPCTVCAALTPQGEKPRDEQRHEKARGLCTTCARYAVFPKVRAASRSLAVAPGQPTPLLSDDERAVAVYGAKLYLAEKLQELLPQVLADPLYKPHLEFAARCYLAHELEKPLADITEADLSRLDARIARALGRWR